MDHSCQSSGINTSCTMVSANDTVNIAYINNGNSNDNGSSNHYYMRQALEQAYLAYQQGEIPVGAVVVSANGEVIGKGYNRTIMDADPTAHAEIMALRMAAKAMGNYRLTGCKLYVSLEPCMMCLGAILHSRLSEIVFAARDVKTGACGGVIDIHANHQLNHQTRVSMGILQEESTALLRQFFKERRQGKNHVNTNKV